MNLTIVLLGPFGAAVGFGGGTEGKHIDVTTEHLGLVGET